MYGDLKEKCLIGFESTTKSVWPLEPDHVAYIKNDQGEFLWPQRFWLIITKYLTMVNMNTTIWGFLSWGL